MREIPPSCITRRWLKSDPEWAKIAASSECHDFERQTARLEMFASRCNEMGQYAILIEKGWIKANDGDTTLTCCLKDSWKQKSGTTEAPTYFGVNDPTLVKTKGSEGVGTSNQNLKRRGHCRYKVKLVIFIYYNISYPWKKLGHNIFYPSK